MTVFWKVISLGSFKEQTHNFGLKKLWEIGFKPKTEAKWSGHQMDVIVNTLFGLKSLLETGFKPKQREIGLATKWMS